MSEVLDEYSAERLKKLAKKNPKLLTEKERESLIAYLKGITGANAERDAIVRAENPYWFYRPTTGQLSEEQRKFLEKHLKREDIPQRISGSLDVHMSEANIRGASGGNQSGKTTTAIVEALMKVSGEPPLCFLPGSRHYEWAIPKVRYEWAEPQFVRVVSVDYLNGIQKNLIPGFMKWTPKEFLMNGKWVDSYSAEKQILSIHYNGQYRGFIEFMSNKQDLASFQGPPRSMLIFDEEPDYEIYKENMLRLVTAKRIDVLFSMTPTNGLSWVWNEIVSKDRLEGSKVEWFQISSVTNPKANLNGLDEIVKEIPVYDEKRMRLLGEFVSLSGLVYGRLFDRRVHVIEPFETGCNCGGRDIHAEGCPYPHYLGYLGIDAHMVKDSCAAKAFIDRDDNFYVDYCYKKGVDTDEFKRDLTALTANCRMDWAVFDPSNDSSLTIHKGVNIFKLCTSGPNKIKRAFKGDKYQGSIAAGVDTIKKRLKINERTQKPKFFIFNRPENQELIRSFMTLQRDSNLNEEIKGKPDKIREGVHDHHACVRYIMQNRLVWKDHIHHQIVSPIPDREAILL